MKIHTKSIADIKIVVIKDDIDANTAPKVTETVLPLVQPKSKILVNMTEVSYMSSAGLRSLLSLYRQTIAKYGKIVLVGLSEDILDTMSVTGFLDFFTVCDTVELGLNSFK